MSQTPTASESNEDATAARNRIAAHYGIPAGLRDHFMPGTTDDELRSQARHLRDVAPQACEPLRFVVNPAQGMGTSSASDPMAGYGAYYDEAGRPRF